MKRGQIWVETVIYTLIGLSLIGIVIALVMPKIGEFKDKATIEQTIEVLNLIDSKVNEVLSAPGNVRYIKLKMRRGELIINGASDEIIYELVGIDTKYSETNVPIEIGSVNILTNETGSNYRVTLSLNFSNYNLTYGGADTFEKFSGVSIPYEFIIMNNGTSETGGKTQIDIRVS